MKIIGIAFVVLSIVAGCKPGPAEQSQPQPPQQPQQQRQPCTEDTSCGTGFHCTAGVCASPPPTAAATTLARWTSIALSATTAISAHARMTVWRIGTAPREELRHARALRGARVGERAGASRAADRDCARPRRRGHQLDFASFTETKTITLRNTGDGPLDYRSSPIAPGSQPLLSPGRLRAARARTSPSPSRRSERERAVRSPSSAQAGPPRFTSAFPKRWPVSIRAPFTSRCRPISARERWPSAWLRTPPATSPAWSTTRARRPSVTARRSTRRAASTAIRSGFGSSSRAGPARAAIRPIPATFSARSR